METNIFNFIYNGDLKNLKKLIESGYNIETRDSFGFTLLHDAVHYGYFDIVKYLIENGANVNETTKNKRNPLHVSFQRKCDSTHVYIDMDDDFKIVEILIDNGTSLDDIDINGKKPLDFIEKQEQKDEILNLIRLNKLNMLYGTI